MKNKAKAPKHLSREARAFWNSVLADFELESDALLILRTACEQFDRMQQARQLLQKDGIVADGKAHPAVAVEKQSTGLFLRCMRQLGLDIDPPGPVGRPAKGGR